MKKIIKMLKNREFRSGFVFAAGALLVLDNIIFHWLLSWHHVIEGPRAYQADFLTFVFGLVLIAYSLFKK
ncbi:TPA: DUF2243 domain-containing protein [archaeon]|uniref:DUF2243 domain-containing protein n=1 Tax=Candidatus Naiadarchaeum limnaeum TaxID=2756139 RepID=A0A832XI06_9ARCH|nr:DUF2243 domain-containing protein [Candidatus Naiadarchaeales archaeon SRR2090153.bin1042]HIK00111.1 DUF2243 domain-containing protein [Candidatus Naiadarchaeum limnaeum]